MNSSNKTYWFALDNEHRLLQMRDDFWDVFLAKLRAAIESGAISEEDMKERPMTVARCVLTIAAEDGAPRSKSGQEMLANLRNFI